MNLKSLHILQELTQGYSKFTFSATRLIKFSDKHGLICRDQNLHRPAIFCIGIGHIGHFRLDHSAAVKKIKKLSKIFKILFR